MKKTITCILLTAGLTGYLSAQTPVQDKSDKNSGKVIRMDKQMFLDNIFDYTSGSTNWKYKGEKPAVIDFYATWLWSLPYGCPSAKKSGQRIQRSNCSLQSRYRQTKRIICRYGNTVTAHHHLYSQNGTATNHYRSSQ